MTIGLVRALPPWLMKGLKHPVASAAAMTLGIRLGQEIYRLRTGELSRKEFEKRAGQHMGALAGTLCGASLGWSLGRALPGFGAIVGAFGGGLIGHIGGEHFGRVGASRVADAFTKPEGAPEEPARASSKGPTPAEGPHETHAEPPVVEEPSESEEPPPADSTG